MEGKVYFQPETCVPGELYYIKVKENGSRTKYHSVKFIGYCPHPAEVIVRNNGRTKVVHRIYLYQKNGKSCENR